jgi:hypothetical protein
MKKIIFTIFAAVIFLSGCNKTDGPGNNGPGKLVLKITDDPFNINYVESATITINKIEIRKAGQNEAASFMVLSEDTLTFDLLKLRNGVTSELLNLDIPQGDYDLIRLCIDQASLKIRDQDHAYKVKVPGGNQTGIKISIGPVITVEGGLTSELLLDFDLSKSFVMRGNMAHSAGVNGFIFKPCIRAVNNTIAGRIEGMVKDTAMLRIVNAKVWVVKDTIMATAYTDTLGRYAFIGIPAGTYSVFASKENYDTTGYNSINVNKGNKTVQDLILHNK